VIWLPNDTVKAIEVKWSNSIRPVDLKMLKQFKDSLVLRKNASTGETDGIKSQPVYQFLYELAS